MAKPMPTAVAVGAALVVGTLSGAALVGEPVTRTPLVCRVMATAATEAFDAYEDQVVAHHNRATRGLSKFAEYDRETKRLWRQIDKAKTDHRAARAACLGTTP